MTSYPNRMLTDEEAFVRLMRNEASIEDKVRLKQVYDGVVNEDNTLTDKGIRWATDIEVKYGLR